MGGVAYICCNPPPLKLSSPRASPPLNLFNLILPHQHKHRFTASAFKKATVSRALNSKVVENAEESHSIHDQTEACDGAAMASIPHVKTVREFPREELLGKVVMVRFDSKLLLHQIHRLKSLSAAAISTVKYLYEAGAKVILVGSWGAKIDTNILAAESFSEYLSSLLQLKVVPVQFIVGQTHSAALEAEILLLENLLQFKEERANSMGFAKLLSSGVDIFVNDAIFESHKILASTVGVSRFCYASIAGFHFEKVLSQMKKIVGSSKKPYVAIVSICMSFALNWRRKLYS